MTTARFERKTAAMGCSGAFGQGRGTDRLVLSGAGTALAEAWRTSRRGGRTEGNEPTAPPFAIRNAFDGSLCASTSASWRSASTASQ